MSCVTEWRSYTHISIYCRCESKRVRAAGCGLSWSVKLRCEVFRYIKIVGYGALSVKKRMGHPTYVIHYLVPPIPSYGYYSTVRLWPRRHPQKIPYTEVGSTGQT